MGWPGTHQKGLERNGRVTAEFSMGSEWGDGRGDGWGVLVFSLECPKVSPKVFPLEFSLEFPRNSPEMSWKYPRQSAAYSSLVGIFECGLITQHKTWPW